MTVNPLPPPAVVPGVRRWRLLGGVAALLAFAAGFGIGATAMAPPAAPLAGIAFSGGSGFDAQ